MKLIPGNPDLLLDMDGIIGDFNRHSIHVYNSIQGTNFELARADEYIQDHDVVHPDIDVKALRRPYREPGFFIGLPPIPGAVEAVRELKNHFNIYILSTHYYGNTTCVWEKEAWLQRHFPFIADQGIFTKHKSKVGGAILVDDRPKNLLAWKAAQGGATASLGYSWINPSNADIIGKNWEELAEKIIKHFKR